MKFFVYDKTSAVIALLVDLKAVVVDLQVALVVFWAAMEDLLVVLGPPGGGGPPVGAGDPLGSDYCLPGALVFF